MIDKYDVLMVDPPWYVPGYACKSSLARHNHREALPYETTRGAALWELLDRGVFSQAAPHHAVFLWALDQYLAEAEAAMCGRGYRLTGRIIWDKGNGPLTYRLRRSHEYLLWYCKPRLLAASPAANAKYRSVICGGLRENSRKPSAAYAMVEALYPDARKLDAFTREYRQGWDGWGDQIDYFSPLFACLR